MDLVSEIRKKKPPLRGIINSHLEAIKQVLDEGYTKKEIYNKFKENGEISNDYFYFVKILNQELNRKESKSKNKQSFNDFRPKKGFQMVELDEDDLK